MSTTASREAELDAKRAALRRDYPRLWSRMVDQWRAPRDGDAAWLMYAGSYLFNTAGVKWAIDPVTLGSRIAAAPPVPAAHDLRDLSFVLLTHAHADHVDESLWRDLSTTPTRWIVPAHMMEWFRARVQVPPERITPAVDGETIEVEGLTITPFASLHFATDCVGVRTGVEETGYLIDTGRGRYLFPGDVRTYDAARLPNFGDVTAVFAHVFLGRSEALEPRPSQLDEFVDFYLSFRPRKIILTHLDELGRHAADCWVREHAEMVRRDIHARDPSVEVVIPEWFEEVVLAK